MSSDEGNGNGDRVSVARATLRAELSDLELRLVDRINVALEKTADRAMVEALDKRVDGLEIYRAERVYIPAMLDKMSDRDDEQDIRLTALERFRYAVPSTSVFALAVAASALAYSLTH